MHAIWNTIFYKPLFNALIFFINIVPWQDVGIALILLTVLVKLILFPLSQKSIKSQVAQKEIEPELRRIKELYPTKEEQAKKTMELYKDKKVNPFSSCLVILIQFPIIIALYYVFFKGLKPPLNTNDLYSFVHLPEHLNTKFLGIIDMNGKNIILALLAGITQFFQMKIVLPKQNKNEVKTTGKAGFSDQMMKSMNLQMKYFLPVFIAFISYTISAAVALYWTTSNIFTIGQEILVRRKIEKNKAKKVEVVSSKVF